MARIKSGTLVTNTVATVSLDQPYGLITVVNPAGTAAIYFTLDGTAPTVLGDNCYCVPGGSYRMVPGITSIAQKADGTVTGSTVKLIATGTPIFTVEGI